MDFVQFARLYGVMIDSLPEIGRWKRYPTESKPKHRNGAVKFMGDHGFVQDHATMQEVAVWQAGKASAVELVDYSEQIAAAKARVEEERRIAASRAEWIMSQCVEDTHPYLDRKGFPGYAAHVWYRKGVPILCIPMYIGDRLSSAQMITPDGQKRFVSGGETAGATHIIGEGPPIYCEGFATGLSVRCCLGEIRRSVVVCFSAGNMTQLAKAGPQSGLVIADNDESRTGEKAAKATGKMFWMPDVVGEDFNDYHLRVGQLEVEETLRRLVSRHAMRLAKK